VLKVALRGLLAHKARLVTTFAAVALGVAFMGGVLVLTDTMNRSFDDLFADVYRETDAVVRSDETFESDFGEVRGMIDASLVPQVESSEGVAAAAGGVDGYAQIVDEQGDVVGDPGRGAPTFGANWVEVDELNPFDIDEGRAPETDGEIVIDRGSAKDTDYEVGDTVPVQTREGIDEFELVGITRFGTADNPGGASYVMWTDDEAQHLVGEAGRFSTIAVAAEDGVSQRQVADEIGRALDDDGVTGVEVVTGEEITEETQSNIKEALSFLTIFFLVFAIIALFVGTFVIYNSFSIIVAQRTREMALLRAIGARRRQIRRSVIIEALVVGLTGSLLGFLIGLGLATLLGSFLQLPSGGLAILPMSVAVAIVTGVVVTVVSAVLPAWRASRVAPLAAMREVAVDRTGRSLARFAIGLVVLAVGVAVVISGALGTEPATVGVGAALVFVSLVVISPGLARPVSRVLGAPLARLRGVAGRLAKENAGRNPKRTSATAQALMIGVGLVAFIFVINASIRASIDRTLDESFAGDFVVDTGTFGLIGLPTSVAAEIEQLPDVALVSPLRFSPAKVAGADTSVVGTNAGAFELLDLGMVDGTDELDPGQLVISQSKADSEDLAVGDELGVSFLDDRRPDDGRTVTVAGIYDDTTAAGGIGPWVVGLDDYDDAVANATDAQVFVQLRDGVSVAEAEPEIEQVVEPYATAEVQSVDEFKDALGSQLDFFLNLIVVLLALSVFIAVLGIGNTIALSVFERTRELGLLRAVGMRRRQVRSTVRWEAMIISLFGTTLGLAFGLVGGWGIVRSLRDEGFGVFEVPVGPFVGLAIVGALVGAAASVWPAWRASRLNVLDAIASE
jgi:putative ABC transport system permease protein